jgi:hypothetical protein
MPVSSIPGSQPAVMVPASGWAADKARADSSVAGPVQRPGSPVSIIPGGARELPPRNANLPPPRTSSPGVEVNAQKALPRVGAQADKTQPYLSRKGENVHLNGRISLDGEAADKHGATAVWCRHLAISYVLAEGKKRDLVTQFNSEEGIRNRFSGRLKQTDEAYTNFIHSAPQESRHLVNDSQWGRYLGAIGQQLQDAPGSGPKDASILIMTGNHAMAAHIENKGTHFAVKVFDPNNTDNHFRVEAKDLADLESLSLKSMLMKDQRLIADYFPAGAEEGKVAVVCRDVQIGRPQTHFTEQVHPENPLHQDPGAPVELAQAIGNDIGLALLYNMPGAIKQSMQRLESAGLDETWTEEALQAKTQHGMSLKSALHQGNAEAVGAYFQGLETSKLDREDIKALSLGAEFIEPGAKLSGRQETVMAAVMGGKESVDALVSQAVNLGTPAHEVLLTGLAPALMKLQGEELDQFLDKVVTTAKEEGAGANVHHALYQAYEHAGLRSEATESLCAAIEKIAVQ